MRKFYTWIEHLNDLFWYRVVNSTYQDPKSLSAYRIVIGLFLLVTYMPNFGWIAHVPKTFFDPPLLSLSNFFPGFPGEVFFFIIDFFVLASLVCLTLGVKARVFAMVFLISCIVGLNFQYSFGKISHVILAYVLFGCMAYSGWGRYLALLRDGVSKLDNTAKCLSLFAVLLCFGMFTAGIEKAFVWLDFDLGFNGFLSWSQNSIFKDYKHFLLAPYVKYFPPLILELFDYTAVIFELSPLLFLLHSRQGWKIWLLIASTFHLANSLLLNIPFPLHSIVYLVFVDFRWLYDKLKTRLGKPRFKLVAITIVSLVALVRFAQIIIGESVISTFFSIEGTVLLNLYLSIMIWCIVIFLITRSLLSDFSKGYQKQSITYA